MLIKEPIPIKDGWVTCSYGWIGKVSLTFPLIWEGKLPWTHVTLNGHRLCQVVGLSTNIYIMHWLFNHNSMSVSQTISC